MNRIGGAIFFGLCLGTVAVGCGGGGGGADPASVKSELSSPTGTFEPTATSELGASASAKQKEGSQYGSLLGGFGGLGGMGAMSASSPDLAARAAGRLALRSLNRLDLDADADADVDADFGGFDCPDAGNNASGSGGGNEASANITCKCKGGGEVKIEYKVKGLQSMQTGPVNMNVGMSFGACKSGDVAVDGSMRMEIDAPKGISASSSYTEEGSEGSLIFAAALKVVKGTEIANIEFGYGYVKGRLWYLVKTDKGTFAVNADPWDDATKTGTVYVKAKNGEWTCQVDNGTANCTEGISAGASAEGSASTNM